jgi:putative membrane protein
LREDKDKKEERMKYHQQLLALAAVCAMALFGVMAWAQKYPSAAQSTNNSANRLTSGDSTFATKAAQGGMAEVKLGELAKEKASSRAVKDFGQRMVDDHSKVNDELKSLAARKDITLPTTLDSKDQSTYDHLSSLSGVTFDKEYMRDMISDHRTDISEFKHEADHGTDPDLKAFASKTLPTLEEHLRLAESTDNQVKTEK